MVPEGWAEKPLESLTKQKVTYGVVKPGDERTGGVLFVRGGDFPNGKIRISELRTINGDVSKAYKRTLLRGGEILVSLVGYPGATAIVPNELAGANIARQAALVRPSERVDRDYLFQFLRSDIGQKRMLSQTIGSAQQVINLKDLNALHVVCPPLPEQKKIADILSTWDRAIETSEALLATARTQKRGLMQSLLTGKRRFPEFEGQAWQEMLFEELFIRVRRKNTVGNEKTLTISGQDGLVSQLDYFNKRVAAADLSGYTLLVGGDFAYNKSYSSGYPMGAIKMLPDGQSGVVSSLYLCFALADQYSHCREFFRHFFEFGCFNREIYKIAQEGARNHGLLNVSVHDFFRAKITVPGREEQERIAEAIDVAEREEAHDRAVLEKLRAEKKALMQQLLTGKRRVEVHKGRSVQNA
ncbi:restriction endonuclease subunit S [Roseovarius sp. S1116L3]|uniref:restriction endonuclease subunit S n=1 Tax=Roseovarius roseus TaxID=3342636 RepID=UPI0037265810